MNTKVKGDKIKEGSIPLSALADDVKGEFDGKYGYKNCKGVLNIHNAIVYAPINVYYIYSTDYNKSILLNPGSTVNLNSMGGPSINITSEIYEGNNVKISIDDTSSVGAYGNLYVYQYHKSPTFPTPDWNAQKGEAGYIENKPFGGTRILGEIIIVSTEPLVRSVTYIIPINEFDTIKMYYNSGYIDWINLQIDVQNKPVHARPIGIVSESPIGDFMIQYTEESDYIQLDVLPTSIPGDEDTFTEIGVDYILNDCIVEGIKKLPTQYLPIDPVVWKYMCNPCIIKSGNKVPKELIGDFDEENQCFYFKYPYKNMYVVDFRGNRINLTDASVISIKANGCIENAANEINIVCVEVWIDKDKEWYVEG